MKLEYLDDITENGKYPVADPKQLLRLYDFDHLEIIQLSSHLQDLIEEQKSLFLDSLSFIHPVNCNLVFRIAAQNKGTSTIDKKAFYCDLVADAYRKMIMLLEPFRQQSATGYQWLYDLDTEIDLLVSKGGSW